MSYFIISYIKLDLFINGPILQSGTSKNYFRLIRVLLSTEIFSKRRKIYSTTEEKPE